MDIANRRILFFVEIPDHNECEQQQNDSHGKGDPCTLGETGYKISDKGDNGNQDRIRQLCGHMTDMITLCAGGGHDRGIGDRRTVIATYRTRHTG